MSLVFSYIFFKTSLDKWNFAFIFAETFIDILVSHTHQSFNVLCNVSGQRLTPPRPFTVKPQRVFQRLA